MKRTLLTLSLLASLGIANEAMAQQVVDSPVKQVVVASKQAFANTIEDVDRLLLANNEPDAFKAYDNAISMLSQNLTSLKEKAKAGSTDGERLMYTEKYNDQAKHLTKLRELSVHLLQNRNLVNIEFKEALKNM
ncbi:MAG: hypothetical protein EOP51_06695 [Sphingobacteriales bacterium]|nr:MAG: hypothetical protein EOP51_06695 [Sphingobacteriales bacterium]